MLQDILGLGECPWLGDRLELGILHRRGDLFGLGGRPWHGDRLGLGILLRRGDLLGLGGRPWLGDCLGLGILLRRGDLLGLGSCPWLGDGLGLGILHRRGDLFGLGGRPWLGDRLGFFGGEIFLGLETSALGLKALDGLEILFNLETLDRVVFLRLRDSLQRWMHFEQFQAGQTRQQYAATWLHPAEDCRPKRAGQRWLHQGQAHQDGSCARPDVLCISQHGSLGRDPDAFGKRNPSWVAVKVLADWKKRGWIDQLLRDNDKQK